MLRLIPPLLAVVGAVTWLLCAEDEARHRLHGARASTPARLEEVAGGGVERFGGVREASAESSDGETCALPLSVDLDLDVAMRLVVRDAASGAAVAGAVAFHLGGYDVASGRRSPVGSNGVRADHAGRIEFRGLRPWEELHFYVRAEGYTPRIVSGQSGTTEFEVELARGAPAVFEVTGREGHAIAGVRLAVVTSCGHDVAAVWTDNAGRAEVPVAQRDSIRAEKPGYATKHVSADQRAIELGREFRVAGRVVTIEGRPIRGATLRGQAEDGERRSDPTLLSSWEAVTDADGRFVVEALGFSHWKVAAECDGHQHRTFRTWSGDESIEIVLGAAARVSGIVLEPDGTPTPRPCVELEALSSETDVFDREPPDLSLPNDSLGVLRDAQPRFCHGDLDGGFDFESVPPGTIRVRASSREGLTASATFQVSGGQWLRNAVIRLDATPRAVDHQAPVLIGEPASRELRVVVLEHDGTPAIGMRIDISPDRVRPPGATLTPTGLVALPPLAGARAFGPRSCHLVGGLSSSRALTDADGRARVGTTFSPGTPVLVRAAGGSDASGTAWRPRLAADVRTAVDFGKEIVVKLPRPLRVQFRIRPWGPYSFFVAGNARLLDADSGPGVFSYALDPSARFDLTVAEDGRVVYEERGWRPSSDQTVRDVLVRTQARSDESRHVPFVVRGQVRDDRGVPVGGAVVAALVPGTFDDLDMPATSTRADGAFEVEFDARPPWLRVLKRGSGVAIVAVARGELGVITLAGEGRLSIGVDSAKPWAPLEFRIDLGIPLPDGSTHWERRTIKRARQLDFARAHERPSSDWFEAPAPLWASDLALEWDSAGGEIDGLVPGRYRVRLWTSGWERTLDVEVEAGRASNVTFDLPRD